MKLYFFESGIIKTQKHFLVRSGEGIPYDIPIPFYLIEHPKGNVLFDTGLAYDTIDKKVEYFGDAIVAVFDPIVTEEQWCANALQKVNCKPEDIKYVILSHLHADHAGCVGDFPNAKYIVQRDELHQAYVHDYYMKASYTRKDFDKNVNWLLLNGWRDDKLDLFNDGSIIIYFTPGHSPGHQSLLVNLPNSGPMFFTADACCIRENLDSNVLPTTLWNVEETVRSVERIKFLQECHDVKIITGHDPEDWQKFKKAPEYYD